jgi:hypothetical protein
MPASYRLTLKGILGGVPVENTWTIRTPRVNNDFGEAEEIRDIVQTNGWVDAWLDCCPTDYFLMEIEVRGIVVEDGGTIATPSAVDAFIGSQGTRTGDRQSNQDGPMLSYFPEIVVGERARVNKTFLPGITESDALFDQVLSGLAGKLATFLDAIDLGLTLVSGTADFALLIRRLLDITIPYDPVTNPYVFFLRSILATGIEQFVASQNRRRPVH